MARYDEIADSVNSKFDETSEYAASAWIITKDFIKELATLAPPGFQFKTLLITWDDITVDFTGPVVPDRPVVDLIIPDMPEPPVLEDVDIDDIDIPTLDVVPPEYNSPDFPDDEMPDVPTELPPIEDITYPTAPDYELPDVPELGGDISVPEPPEVTIPEFDVSAPEFTLESPGNSFVYSEGVYESDLLDAAREWLEDQFTNGSTGLDAEVEQAIIDRAEARQQLKHAAKYNEANEYFAGMHHTLPPGALSGRLLEIQEQIGQEEQQLSDDVLIEQAKLAQANTHFVVQQALGFEKLAIEHFNAVATRAFEVARTVQQAAMEVFNAQVAHYNIQLDKYKTEAAVYEIRIRAGNLILERYKALLQGLSLQSSIRKDVLELYNLQLDGVKTLYSLYQVEMESARIRAQVNATVIEAYRTRITAYNSVIGAITAKYNGYQAQLAGEQTKADLYKTQVQAYSERIKALATAAQIDIENARARLQNNQLLIDNFKAEIEGFNADLSGRVSEINAELDGYKAEVTGYTAEVDAELKEAEALIESYKARAQHETNLIRQKIAQAEVAMDHSAKLYGIQVEQYKAGANVAAQLAASALTAVSAAASYGYNEGVSTSYSYDQTKSDPTFSYIVYL